jgi:hypothetical protein
MIPEIDYDQQAIEVLPDGQRTPYWIVFMRAMFSPVKWLYGKFKAFAFGESLDSYDATIAYAVSDKVKYKFGTWESQQNDNTGNTPNSSPDYWIKRNDSFIGADERVVYDGKKLNFERALNRIFETTFRQPDDVVNPTHSDIYITNAVPDYTSFVMYPDSEQSSVMYPDGSEDYMFDTSVYDTASTYAFIIHTPIAIWNALGDTDAVRESIVRNFADRYAPSGTTYSIAQY